MTGENFIYGKEIVEYIMDSVDTSEIENVLIKSMDQLEECDFGEKIKFLSHMSVLFLNINVNELSFRNKLADEKSMKGRKICSQLITKYRTEWSESPSKNLPFPIKKKLEKENLLFDLIVKLHDVIFYISNPTITFEQQRIKELDEEYNVIKTKYINDRNNNMEGN